MAYTEYFSTDASAPILDGLAGSLVNLLDKILSDGYGAKVSLGWAKEFTGTNKRAYRAATGTSRMRLRVDDSGGLVDARFIGYETMSDVDTGTGPFPTNAQVSGGLHMRKSSTATSVVRPWYACGTEKWIYFHSFAAQTVFGNSASTDGSLFFGELDSLLAGDTYNTLIIGRTTISTSVEVFGTVAPSATGSGGHYIPRSYVGGIGAVNVTKIIRGPTASSPTVMGGIGIPYPDPISGRIPLSKIDIYETVVGGAARRLIMPPEIRCPIMNLPGNAFDTFSGVDGIAGQSFRLLPTYVSGNAGRVALKVA